MRFLIYQWNSYTQRDLYDICDEKGIGYDVFEWKFDNKNFDEKFVDWFCKNVKKNYYDALVSINYFPVLSEVCQKYQLKYIAWCYDAPLNVERIEETLGNAVNYVFLFDRMQYLEYHNKGFRTVWHLPLGVNSTRLKNLKITEQDQKKYCAEVSFVGCLYESKIGTIMDPLKDYTKGYLKCLMDMQDQIYGRFILDDIVDNKLIQEINDQYKEAGIDNVLVINKAALLFAMASEITRRNRVILLNLCGRRFDTHFYSYDDGPIENVKKCGTIDYIEEMPKMFRCSKINLNPSLRIIKSGIPMRAFDIMGAGGFLLSNWQEELLELFEEESEVAVYDSYDDAIAKIDFYLKHDTLRENIRNNGRNKTLEEHSLQNRLQTILKIAEI